MSKLYALIPFIWIWFIFWFYTYLPLEWKDVEHSWQYYPILLTGFLSSCMLTFWSFGKAFDDE